MEYKLSINEKQAQLLVKALDFFSRIKCGQLEELTELFREVLINHEREVQSENIFASVGLVRELKSFLFPELHLGASYGIREACGEDEKIAYDFIQVIRHQFAWDQNPGGGFGVNFYEPHKISSQELPKIERAT